MAEKCSSHDDHVEVAPEKRRERQDLEHEVDEMIHQQDGALLVDIGAKCAEEGAQGAVKLAKDGHVRKEPPTLRRPLSLILRPRPSWFHSRRTIQMTLSTGHGSRSTVFSLPLVLPPTWPTLSAVRPCHV